VHFGIYDVLYSQNSHQHVSAGIPAIFRVILLYKNAKIQITPHRQNNFSSKDLNNYPCLDYIYITYIILSEIIIIVYLKNRQTQQSMNPYYLYYLVGRHVSVPYRTIIRSFKS